MLHNVLHNLLWLAYWHPLQVVTFACLMMSLLMSAFLFVKMSLKQQ